MELEDIRQRFSGGLQTDSLSRRIYSTDASAYQQLPAAVAVPKNEADLQLLIEFANSSGVGLIPRTAGTSLAGQVVGDGIVVDVSKHFTEILEVNAQEKWVRVQPGVIRNELNQHLNPMGLMFGPETSTQNRAMIGGMVGNNSCGSNSVRFGSVRDHLIEVTGFLADGTKTSFGPLSQKEFEEKCNDSSGIESAIYAQAFQIGNDPATGERIATLFPKPEITRRNTGYAIDRLIDSEVFPNRNFTDDTDKPFNFCQLIAGSEGTLFFATEFKLKLVDLSPPRRGLHCAHFHSIDEALKATQIAIRHDIYACELIDHFILECTKRSIEHRENRFFLEGEPAAILVTEFCEEDDSRLTQALDRLTGELRAAELGYAYPTLLDDDCRRVWDLRKAGLGLLSNMPGDAKPVAVIEDTAVAVSDLPHYIAEFDALLKERFQLECVHYAHAGSGEIHLRPIINLKTAEGNRLFREVAKAVAGLVKKYRGSLSGEHGDGRLRGEFLAQMVGEENYQLMSQLKRTWDPHGILNPGKIIDTPRMNESLRYDPNAPAAKEPTTIFDFSASGGMLRLAEMCNGSGDCRKTQLTGGTMCPSYMATRNEKDTTRARANTLRQILTHPSSDNPLDSQELHAVMDLCLSCKGCKAECPSTVDVGKMKGEVLHHYYQTNGIPWRSRLIGAYAKIQRIASIAPRVWNKVFGISIARKLLNRMVGFHPERSIPNLAPQRFSRWFANREVHHQQERKVYLFCDEFTEYSDVAIGIACVELLQRLGYQVLIADHTESGRSYLSKGLLKEARKIARQNVNSLKDKVNREIPMIGIEPSAILGFRDEYPDLVGDDLKAEAQELSESCFLFEEWFAEEVHRGNINSQAFTNECREVWVHGHCHQKALGKMSDIRKCLTLPANYTARLIPSGCCGMAGSFGYEIEHYELSKEIGNLVLLPEVRTAPDDVIIAASGTSCRHQIRDFSPRRALHSAEILRDALLGNES